MITLPNEMLYNVFLNLSLKDIKNTSSVCKIFFNIFKDEIFWKRFVPSIVPDNVNCRFLEKHGSKLSIKQLLEVDFSNKIEFLKAKKDIKRRMLYKLVYSIRTLEKFMLNQPFEGYESQRPYAYLFLSWGPAQTVQEMEELKESALTEKGRIEWEKEKTTLCLQTDQALDKNDFKVCSILFFGIQLYLQIEANEQLIDFYSELWKSYSPFQLDPQTGFFAYMPLEAFNGYCQFVNTTKKIDVFSSWFLSEAHLILFNNSFKNCSVNDLSVCLTPNVKKESLSIFIDLVRNETHFLSVSVIFMTPQFEDSKEFFQMFYAEGCKNIKMWQLM